ncbi:MAG: radical SAM protein [Candidatus Woesebacteria bacterium]|nr:radical SAM protein [Candidatus Woesebacteria bacterium]
MLKQALGYRAFRTIGYPKLLPMNITFGLTMKCNSLCKTCNIGLNFRKNPQVAANELTLDEYEKILKNIGHAGKWFVLSGGEPFMKQEIDKIAKLVNDNCKPDVIVIPTNGLLRDLILKRVENILEWCKDTPRVTINLSIDGIGDKHDYVRGVKGNFERSMETFAGLKALKEKYKNLEVGVHTVVSKLNCKDFPEIYEYVEEKLKPDSYITEIAEQRVELDSMGLPITPDYEEYKKAIDLLINGMEKKSLDIKQRFRLEYYRMVKEWLQKRTQIFPCYAGWASAQINARGEVWSCCIRAESVGNLREHDYDLSKVWFNNKRMDKLRESIKKKECDCPLASANYSNMLFNAGAAARIGFGVVKNINKLVYKNEVIKI